MKCEIRVDNVSAMVKLENVQTKDIIHNPKVEKRSASGGTVRQKQLITDSDGFPIEGEISRIWVNGDGKAHSKEEIVDVVDGDPNAQPFAKTEVLELSEECQNPDDYVYDKYYEVVPQADNQITTLFKIAEKLEVQPREAEIVMRKGYKKALAIVTAEVDRQRGKFAVLLRLTNSRIRLTKSSKIPEGLDVGFQM